MSLWHLVIREIRHRYWNFLLGLISVTAAVACLVASLTILKGHEVQTQQLLAAKQTAQEQALALKQAEVERRVSQKERALKDKLAATQHAVQKVIDERKAQVKEAGVQAQNAARVITKGLGSNVLILPEKQDLNELYTEGMLSETMPEDRVATLSNSKIMTINHILPLLTHKEANWPGPLAKQTIVIVGTRGEVPLSHRDPKKPLGNGKAVKPGTAVVGYGVATRQKLKVGSKITLLGKTLTVTKTHTQRGTVDDSTIWMNLKETQAALGKQNLINAIYALECNCATADRVGEIRRDIKRILPGTQVVERDAAKALARAESRNQAKVDAKAALQRAIVNGDKLRDQVKSSNAQLLHQEQQAAAAAIALEKSTAAQNLKAEADSRNQQQTQRESFTAILVPLVIVGCGVWIGLLTYLNVRQRSAEIGVLRAIGLRSREILTIFLSKALLIGVVGAAAGYAIGFGLGLAWGDLPATAASGEQVFDATFLLLAVLISLLLSALASWIPAMLAARQDPAVVLQLESV